MVILLGPGPVSYTHLDVYKRQVKAFGTASKDDQLKEMQIERRELTPTDVEIEILFCGVCHSDLHTARNDWGGTKYPSVPGHEIVGRITKIGSDVTKFKVGDLAGVGCIVDSCKECESCKQDLEQYCLNGFTGTYNANDKHLHGHTFGGYSEKVVVTEAVSYTHLDVYKRQALMITVTVGKKWLMTKKEITII